MASTSVDGAPVPPQAQAKVNGIVENDAAKGRVPVHTFDPNASPEAKAAAAGKEKNKLGLEDDNVKTGAKELTVDTGKAKASVLPTITIEDVDRNRHANGNGEPLEKSPASPTTPAWPASPTSSTSPKDPEVPGAMPDGPAPAIPDWYKLGWRDVSGIDDPTLAEGEEKDKEVLALFIKEQFYGEWYHNAALIVATVIVTHFLTRFHFGWGWLFILLAFCNTYYSMSMKRLRARARDDIQRELVKTRLSTENEVESADWINNFLDRFWLIYEPVLSRTIVASVDQVLSQNCPPFLDSLRLSTFTLGTKAPRIDKVKTYPRTEDDVVVMEWWLSFSPNDTSDLTERQKLTKVNPKIILSVRVGKGLASAAMPILLEDMSFSGHLKIRLKLMTNFPHVQLVDLSFMEKPAFDYVLKPIGGETFGFDIANVPGLSAFIRDTVHSVLGPMMYDPNVFTLNLEQMLSGEPIDTAIGVLQVTIQGARDLKGSKLGGGRPDPFVSLSINERVELARTKFKHNTVNPSWMETKFLLVNSLTENLILRVWDYNDHRANTDLGFATFDLTVLEQDATQENIEAPILKDGKERGKVRFDVNFYPVLKPEVDAGGKETLPDTKVGIVRLTVHQAKDLDSTKSITGDLNPFVKLYTGSNKAPVHVTRKLKHTNNPVWEESTEFLCTDKSSSVVIAKVIDDRDFLKDPVVGYMSVRLTDLLKAKVSGKDWWPLSGARSGKMRLSAEWKPLNMAGSLHGVDQYVPPIGVVRLWLQKATDVKNVEATLGGKSDPYVRVQINNITQGRTEVVNNNLNPEWDQIIYIPVHSLKETMLLECMDYQHLTKDRSLGYTELKVSDLAKPSEAETGEFLYESKGKRDAEEPLKLGNGAFKGKLHYVAEFIPAYAVRGIRFDSHANELQEAAARVADRASAAGSDIDEGETVRDDESVVDIAAVPEGITAAEPVEEDERSEGEKGHRRVTSTDTAFSATSAASARTSGTSAVEGAENGVEEKRPEEQGIEMSKEELFKHQAGIVIFNVISGRLHKKARLEVLLDDAYWPAFSTIRPRSTHAQWDYIGEGVIKELDFSRVWLRLNEADEGDKDDVIAEWKGDAKAFLDRTLDGPTEYTLVDPDDEDKKSTVVLETRYLPVPIKLEARESVNNQGLVRVDLIDGHSIHAADRGGKSDPFVVFHLNGQRVYKSQTKKKTLNPEWNESFTVQVPSRAGANFQLEVFDWNQIEQAKSLGAARIDLESLEPFTAVERSLPLSHAKHGEKGEIRVRLLFTPEIIVKTRKNTSTFSTAGRAMTQIGHLPVGAGKGVLQGVTGVFKKHGNSSGSESEDDRPEPPAGVVSKQVDYAAEGGSPTAPSANFPTVNEGGAHSKDPGTLRVVVQDAKDLSTSDIKPYVVVRVGDKEQKTKHSHKTATPEWNESFAFAAAPATQPKMFVWVYDHKTLGKDKLLGSADIDIWQHLQPGEAVPSRDLTIELREGQGLLHLRLEYDPDTPLSTRASRTSLHSITGATPNASPSRFSLSRRRGADRDD
ncbi:tricalbin [Trametes coccinea BRFM310]|uniref:Tricalbin n=1 Tax=Trametes coccinea (strain BRFM310) TaxID=1353009 RepID=A0A1Y2J107_TRAC3|nr:tricalbin [Trametes coccinea BRFM310]